MTSARSLVSTLPHEGSRGSTVWPARGVSRAALMSALAVADELGTGELLAEHSLSGAVGRVFLHEGQIAWVVAGNDRQRLTDVLERAGIDAAVLKTAYLRCQKEGGNLGEAVIALGIVDETAVRDALRQHNASQLDRLLRAPLATVRFTPVKRTYASSLLFRVDELLADSDEAPLEPHDDPPRFAIPATTTATDASAVPTGEQSMSNIKGSLEEVMSLDGAIAAALVDWESGLTLGIAGGGNGFDIELAASGNTGVVKAKMNVMKALGITGGIEDILITLANQYHLIRPLASNGSLFMYVAIDKARGNLGLARHKLRQIETGLTI